MSRNKVSAHVEGKLRKEYTAWQAMKARCYQPSYSGTKYQEKGIQVCERWKNSFDAFYEDMGPAPSHEYSLDRIDNNGDYSPGNCRWANQKTQAGNRGDFNHPITYQGRTQLLSQWCEELGLNYRTIKDRLRKEGLGAFPKMVGEDPYKRLISFNNKSLTIGQWAKELGISRGVLSQRKLRGWPIERMLTEPLPTSK